jgi:hypothetical protein
MPLWTRPRPNGPNLPGTGPTNPIINPTITLPPSGTRPFGPSGPDLPPSLSPSGRPRAKPPATGFVNRLKDGPSWLVRGDALKDLADTWDDGVLSAAERVGQVKTAVTDVKDAAGEAIGEIKSQVYTTANDAGIYVHNTFKKLRGQATLQEKIDAKGLVQAQRQGAKVVASDTSSNDVASMQSKFGISKKDAMEVRKNIADLTTNANKNAANPEGLAQYLKRNDPGTIDPNECMVYVDPSNKALGMEVSPKYYERMGMDPSKTTEYPCDSNGNITSKIRVMGMVDGQPKRVTPEQAKKIAAEAREGGDSKLVFSPVSKAEAAGATDEVKNATVVGFSWAAKAISGKRGFIAWMGNGSRFVGVIKLVFYGTVLAAIITGILYLTGFFKTVDEVVDEAAETISEVICSLVGQGEECVENIKENVKIGLYVALVVLILWLVYIMSRGSSVVIQPQRGVPIARPVAPVIQPQRLVPIARPVAPVIGKRVSSNTRR